MFDGARFVVLGGTGFLGKIFWIMLLDRYPSVGKLFLLCRSGKGKTSTQRFWDEIATSEAMEPLRKAHGANFEAFLRERIVPIDGDVGRPQCGVDPALIAEWRGTIDAVVNVSGVVDFNPPLDEALDANAFGAQNIVDLCRALGDAPLMHTSTCFSSGNRQGVIYEVDPSGYPFPRCDELGRDLWDPEREIADCLDLVSQAKVRSEDAFRQSEFLEKAKNNLLRRGEPTVGAPLDAELAVVKRRFVADKLVEAGLERAIHWGWPNIYTYTKSIGEQVVGRSGLAYTIVRPASCESTLAFPFPGWNEGIGTSAPIIFMAMKGQHQLLGNNTILDFIPSDYVTAGMIIALAELLEGSHKPVYQFGTSDSNPVTARRLGELIGIYKRKYFLRTNKGNPFINFMQAHYEPAFVDMDRFDMVGPAALARGARVLASMLKKAPGPGRQMAKTLEASAQREEKIDEILRLFAPFTYEQKGPFSCANGRAGYARLSDEDKAKLPWTPEKFDWMRFWMDQHMPAMEKRIIPWMDERYKKELKPLRRHNTLTSLLEQMAERHEHAVALARIEQDGFATISYRALRARVEVVAARLAEAGIAKGSRVILSGKNHPDWAIAYFGILRAGATAVPVDPALEPSLFANIVVQSGATLGIWDEARETGIASWDLHEITAHAPHLVPPDVEILETDIASIIYTSGTTGTPKGVMLTHANFTSLIASLAPVFPLTSRDRVLSVLPLHHTFEFSCGLLLPLSRGARIMYLDELKGERLSHALKQGRATAMVGVPALWQLLERRILSQVEAKGPVVEAAFEWGGELNRFLGKKIGLDLGKLLFASVHKELGGNIRYLISGGAALPKDTQKLFGGLGLHLTEGYGLTEAAPVISVAPPSPKSPPGQVGKPLPGVQVKIAEPDEHGVGEVWAKGPNVMAGYTDAEATSRVLQDDGWLKTGDLGRLDKKGRLVIVGRIKDVIISTTGENVYPDDLENQLGSVEHITELSIVGLEAANGGERIACLAVPAEDDALGRTERLDRAKNSLMRAIGKLPFGKQPSIVHLYEAPLPRTQTRKVKRSEVQGILRRMVAATSRPLQGDAAASSVRRAISALRGMPVEQIAPEASMVADLGFDSLLLTELLVALEAKHGTLDPDRLQACRTVADVEALVGNAEKPASRTKTIEGRKTEEKKDIVFPAPVQEQGKRLIGKIQDAFYGQMMHATVKGRAFIPHNKNSIVVSNHTSHLDMGFVRHALGKYGEDIVSLAAQDYFFEGSELRKAFFKNFSNLKPIDRRAGLRASERRAAEVLESGKTMLIFPEGTRSTDGQVQEFKSMVGHLALTYGVDILPIYLKGTYEALSKGSKLPKRRDIEARIGPPLRVEDMRRLTAGLGMSEAAREVARLTREAVIALQQGRVFDLSLVKSIEEEPEPSDHPLALLFDELGKKFKPKAVDKPVSFYFTLGGDAFAKWTVRIDASSCEIRAGKPESGTADCVLKTSPEIFTRIVRESYVPGVAEFLSGAVKSNDVALLQTFQKAFQLD